MILEGLTLGPIGIALYFLVIVLWSAIVAYVVIFGSSEGEGHATHAPSPSHGPSHGPAHEAPVEVTRAKPFRGFSPYEGFKSYAQGETVTVEDIVKGLARESSTEQIVHKETPSHDTKKSISTAQVNAFLDLLMQGERDAVFDMVRDIDEHGEGAEAFLTRVLLVVESSLEARMTGGTGDVRVMEILGECSTPTLEKLVAALATGDKGKQSGKLVLTRALSALKE